MNSLDSNCFSLFHSNIRSAPKNLEHLDAYLKCINFNFTILGLSETWFNDYTVANYDTNGYVNGYVYRKGVGVCHYLSRIKYHIYFVMISIVQMNLLKVCLCRFLGIFRLIERCCNWHYL